MYIILFCFLFSKGIWETDRRTRHTESLLATFLQGTICSSGDYSICTIHWDLGFWHS